MRLKPAVVNAITDSIETYVQDQKAALYLFGSRVDDSKKGGDIDLLFLATPELLTLVQEKKYRILADIKHQIGEQKIDLVLSSFENAQADLFIQSILPTALLLKEWF